MPFLAPLLRTTLLLSSVTLAASYALYENNAAFRQFVDNIVDKILAAWDHVLASLSPEERQRQREAQRREVLVALSSNGDVQNVRSVFSAASGNDAVEEARVRRRRLFEVAQRNAQALGTGIGDIAAGLENRPTLYENAQRQSSSRNLGGAPDPPEVVPEDATNMSQRTASEPLIPIRIQSPAREEQTVIPIKLDMHTPAHDDEDVRSVSTASMSSYSNILTPTSTHTEDPFASAAESMSRTASLRSASTETMSHFTQSAPPSVVDEDDTTSWDRMSVDGMSDIKSVSEMDIEAMDPSSAAAWEEYRRQYGQGPSGS